MRRNSKLRRGIFPRAALSSVFRRELLVEIEALSETKGEDIDTRRPPCSVKLGGSRFSMVSRAEPEFAHSQSQRHQDSSCSARWSRRSALMLDHDCPVGR